MTLYKHGTHGSVLVALPAVPLGLAVPVEGVRVGSVAHPLLPVEPALVGAPPHLHQPASPQLHLVLPLACCLI